VRRIAILLAFCSVGASLLVLLIVFTPGWESHVQWCARCGLRRVIWTRYWGRVEGRTKVISREETPIYKVLTQVRGPCPGHEWVNESGFINRPGREGESYSGMWFPVVWGSFEDELSWLVEQDPERGRAFLEEVLWVASERGDERAIEIERAVTTLVLERKIEQWRTWWDEYKQRFLDAKSTARPAR